MHKTFTAWIKDAGAANFISTDTLTSKYSYDGKQVKLNYTKGRGPNAKETNLNGIASGNAWNGMGMDADGKTFTWTALFDHALKTSQTV